MIFWNIVRSYKRNNLEDLYAFKISEEKKLYKEKEFKEHAFQYYEPYIAKL